MKNLNKILVNKNSTIKEAMRAIYVGTIRMAVVVDDKKKMIGVVNDGDIRRGILSGKGINEKVLEVTNKHPLFISNLDIEGIRSIFDKNPDIFGLPIIDKNKIVKDFVVISKESELIFFSKTQVLARPLSKILVIGGGGYIGSILTRELISRDYHVKVLDNFMYGRQSLHKLEGNPNLTIMEGDTRHIEVVTDAVSDVDAVVHLAELVGDPLCNINPKVTQEVNYLATKLIASVCKHYQINRFVYTSSCSVYGATENEDLLTEDAPLNPQSLYARMKIESENALLEMVDNNFSPTILRLGTVFGYSSRPRFDLVVNLLTAKAIKEGQITIFGGNQWRPNVHVIDVANSIIRILEAPLDKVAGEIFNVGSNDLNLTINNIGEKIKEQVPEARIIKKDNNGDKRNYKVDFSKILKILNFETTIKIEEGIKEIINAFNSNRIRGDYRADIYSNVQYLKNKIVLTEKNK